MYLLFIIHQQQELHKKLLKIWPNQFIPISVVAIILIE